MLPFSPLWGRLTERGALTPRALNLSLAPKAHWTPHYVVSRIRRAWAELQDPQAPWLVSSMVDLLDDWLQPTDTVVEFGSGRSTVWFAQRAARVVSCEHDPMWRAKVAETLEKLGLNNVEYNLCEPIPEAYLAPARALPSGAAQLVLVDGEVRDVCAVWAAQNVAPGGLVVVDNANWYLPHETRSPSSVGAYGPPASPAWEEFLGLTRGWRSHWTSNGVWDTACWFAPGSR